MPKKPEELVDDLETPTEEPKAGTRSDKLRRRPDQVRYFYMAVSADNIHTGASYTGLDYVYKKHSPISTIFFSDVVTGVTTTVTESVEDFMARWKANYGDVNWDYAAEIAAIKAAAVAARKR